MIEEIYNYRQSSLLTVLISEKRETLCIKFEGTLTDAERYQPYQHDVHIAFAEARCCRTHLG